MHDERLEYEVHNRTDDELDVVPLSRSVPLFAGPFVFVVGAAARFAKLHPYFS